MGQTGPPSLISVPTLLDSTLRRTDSLTHNSPQSLATDTDLSSRRSSTTEDNCPDPVETLRSRRSRGPSFGDEVSVHRQFRLTLTPLPPRETGILDLTSTENSSLSKVSLTRTPCFGTVTLKRLEGRKLPDRSRNPLSRPG